jgi:hypothetical protein
MKTLNLFVAMLLAAATLFGADAYFVRFTAYGSSILWADDILFFNTTPFPVNVRFVGVSNGAAHADTPDLVLPPRRTTSLRANNAITEKWAPNPDVTPLWVLHLDVPPGVIVESRDDFYFTFPLPGQMLVAQSRGKVSMPIFRGLVAPNEPQVQLGTDLGGTDSRVNVGIYNASDQTALAAIEVRRACDDTIVGTRTILVPPNTVVQSVGVAAVRNAECGGTATTPWVYTVTTTVDQPSFTFVSNVNSNVQQSPNEVGFLPVVSLAVTKNERF